MMRETSHCEIKRPELSAGVFVEMQRVLRTNLVPDVAVVLSAVPGCLESFWMSVRAAFSSRRIQDAGDELRRVGRREAARVLEPLGTSRQLSDDGLSREDNRRVRYVVEAFFEMEPVFAVLSEVALRWIAGTASTHVPKREALAKGNEPYLFGDIEFPQVDSLNTLPALFADRYGGRCPLLIRALSVWPDYTGMIWERLSAASVDLGYTQALATMAASADLLAGEVGVSQLARGFGKSQDELVSKIRRISVASHEATLLACALRAMLIKTEMSMRADRMRRSE